MLRYLLGLFVVLACTVQAQNLPRAASGKPDMQGIWQVTAGSGADLERLAGTLPYLPAALAQKQANYSARSSKDPMNRCWLPGTPRVMLLDYPFEITQTDAALAVTFQWQQVYRLIYTTASKSRYEGVESWMGHSRGHWEGDVLVVEVKDFNDRSWLDAAGNFHSGAMQVVERYQLRDADTIVYQATVTDAKVFSKPWVLNVEFKRQKGQPRLMEYQCQAEKEEANGAFERDDRFWYGAKIPATNEPFDAKASNTKPLPKSDATVHRMADGTPDMSGYFLTDAGGANYGLEGTKGNFLTPGAKGVVIDPADGNLPYQQWARTERVNREQPYRGYDDPTAHCFVAGVPRSLYVPSPFHIVQTKDRVVFLHERMAWREIDLKRREHLPDATRLWQGDSIGHFEGDTLVVDTRNFNGKAWHNEVGDVLSHMQTIQETFTPVSEGNIIYRATVSDPIPYKRPWTIELPLNRMDDELLEVACLEDNNDLQHLKDVRDEYRAAQAKK